MINTDLHIHSIYSSDGEFTIAYLIELCQKTGIEFFSITDHNSVKGNEEAYSLAKGKGLGFSPGIEIDCNYKGTDLHVLGYNIDWRSMDFETIENDVTAKFMNAISEMIDNLNKLGFIIDVDSVLTKAEGKLPTPEFFAEVMLSDEKYYTPLLLPYMEGGERSDMPHLNFYLDYFSQGKPAFVPIDFMDYKEAIEVIKDNGGIPIVAHPGLNLEGKEHIVEELLNNGALGLEVFNNYHSMEQIDYFADTVQKNKHLMTCGSDFHGKVKPGISIGQFKFNNKYESYLENSIEQIKSRRQ